MVKDFFNPILALTVFYYFTEFPKLAGTLIRYVLAFSAIKLVEMFPFILNILMVTLRLGTIVTIGHQIQDKVT